MTRAPIRTGVTALLPALPLAACNVSQSVLSPQGPEADRIALLSDILFIGGTAIMILVIVLTAAAMYGRPAWREKLGREGVVVGGGIVFPVVVLTLLLGYGVLATRAGGAPTGPDALRISVVGEQWWWRVIYARPDGSTFETANVIHIPTGRQVEIALTTADVIHSFWVPNLAGKVDMIPGRTNRITIEATEPGISRGQCAEYCGGAHALMAFHVVAMEPAGFDQWLAGASGPALPPQGAEAERGQLVFLSSGCGACHTVRGTTADGVIGPDLTNVGSRPSLGAGILPNTRETMAAWIIDSQHIKPDNLMPSFAIFDEAELEALTAYLAGLE